MIWETGIKWYHVNDIHRWEEKRVSSDVMLMTYIEENR